MTCPPAEEIAFRRSCEYPKYQCTQQVRAFKIRRIHGIEGAGGWLIGLGDSIVLDGDDVIGPSGMPKVAVHIDTTWFQKHKPEVGGYVVFCEGENVDYSPGEAFERKYTALDIPITD